MARGVKASIEDRIAKQSEAVDKAKEKLDIETKKLQDLVKEQEQEQKEKLIQAIESSDKSVDDVLKFLES